MRVPLMLRVEVAGLIVRRPARPEVLQYGGSHTTAVRLRPQLEPGEVLVERIGAIPLIVKAAA